MQIQREYTPVSKSKAYSYILFFITAAVSLEKWTFTTTAWKNQRCKQEFTEFNLKPCSFRTVSNWITFSASCFHQNNYYNCLEIESHITFCFVEFFSVTRQIDTAFVKDKTVSTTIRSITITLFPFILHLNACRFFQFVDFV